MSDTLHPISLDLAPTTTDPVCGMTVDPDAPRGGTHVYAGTAYHFCSEGCRRKFAADPGKYLAGHREAMGAPGTKYICPMDPDVVSDRPGACPKCGMALEPAVPTLDEKPDPELEDMTRRTSLGILLDVPLLVVAMTDMLVPTKPIETAMGVKAGVIIQALLATPIVLWWGWPLHRTIGVAKIGRAHVCTPVTDVSRMPSSA